MERSYYAPDEALSDVSARRKSNGVYNELQVPIDDGIFSKANRKKSISQYCAVLSTCFMCLNFGMGFTCTTILIPELRRNDSEIPATDEQISWISSLNVLTIPLGAIVSGPLAQHLGRRTALMMATIAFMGIWLIFYFATSLESIYTGLFLLGLTSGLVESPLQVYVMETCEPRVRGSGSACLSASFVLGLFLEILIGSNVYWRNLALLNLVPLSMALISLSLVPETPYWLASKGRVKEAHQSLAWLRGWTTSSCVEDEYRSTIQNSVSFRSSDEKSGLPTDIRRVSFCKRFFRRGVMRPFALIGFMFVVSQFNGQSPLFAYAVEIFRQYKSPINAYTITTAMAGFYLIGTVTSVYVVAVWGKKTPTVLSLAVGGLATLVVATYGRMYDIHVISEEEYNSWIPVGGIITSVVATGVGIKVTPWILAGEIFPVDVRGMAAGIVGAICNIFGALANKTYQDTVNFCGLNGAFMIYATINFIGAAVLYFVMPNTEGMTYAEIATLFSDDRIDDQNNNYNDDKKIMEMSPLTQNNNNKSKV